MSSQPPPTPPWCLAGIFKQCQQQTLTQKGTKKFNTGTNSTQISSAMRASQLVRIGKYTGVYNTTLSANIVSRTDSQITIAISGIYYYVVIIRNGVTIEPFLRIYAPNNYLDTAGILPNTLYRYEITPYSTANEPGETIVLQTTTDSKVVVDYSFLSFNGIRLTFTGGYEYLDISRNGIVISNHFTDTTYNDTGLLYNTTYNYSVSSFNTNSIPGNTVNLTAVTYSSLYIVDTTIGKSQVAFVFDGAYQTLAVYRGGAPLITDLSGTAFTDATVLANKLYVYTVKSYNSLGLIGMIQTKNIYTLSSLILSAYIPTSTTITMYFVGRYKNLSIVRNGNIIATGIFGIDYTDATLTANTGYVYTIQSFNNMGTSGDQVSQYIVTSSTIDGTVVSITDSQVGLVLTGAYATFAVNRDGVDISANVVGNTYLDTGLGANTTHLYTIRSYNIANMVGGNTTLNATTNSTIYGEVRTITDSNLVIDLSGAYTTFTVNRNGIDISTNLVGNTFLDKDLSANTAYSYKIRSNNRIGTVGGNVVLSPVTNSTIYGTVAHITDTQIGMVLTGAYTKFNVNRDGIDISTNVVGNTYLDTGLGANTTHTYNIQSYNSVDAIGGNSAVTTTTSSTIYGLVVSVTDSQIVFDLSGAYTTFAVNRNGTDISTNVVGNTYLDTDLSANTLYTYTFKSYNSIGAIGGNVELTTTTNSNIFITETSITDTQIGFALSGGYSKFDMNRNGVDISTNVIGSSYLDTDLSANTTYLYTIQSYNSIGAIGGNITIFPTTSSTITGNIVLITEDQIEIDLSGAYTIFTANRNGTDVSMNVTGNTLLDSDVSANTLYTYSFISYNSVGAIGGNIVFNTSPISTIYSKIKTITYTQIGFDISGVYSTFTVNRDGVDISMNQTGNTFLDSDLSANMTYTYLIKSFNAVVEQGGNVELTTTTNSNIFITETSITESQIGFTLDGAYSKYNVNRDGTDISSNVIGNAYLDTDLSANTTYLYTIQSYNSIDVIGGNASVATTTSSTIYGLVVSVTDSQIGFDLSGAYTTFTVNRDGVDVSTNLIGNTYLDTGLTSNTIYTYLITSYNGLGSLGGNVILEATTNNII